MERIKTIATRDLTKSVQTGGCGECQAFAGRHFFVGCFVLYGGQNGTSV